MISRSIRALSRVVAWSLPIVATALSIVMLLLFPLHFTAHDFSDHYRTHKTRRFVVRHTAVETVTVDHSDGSEAQIPSRLPALLACIPPRTFRSRPAHLASLVRRRNFVVKLKLGSSPPDNPDPLV